MPLGGGSLVSRGQVQGLHLLRGERGNASWGRIACVTFAD
jgi:hypothetical protein